MPAEGAIAAVYLDEDFGTSCTGAATGNDTASALVSEGAKLQFPLLAIVLQNSSCTGDQEFCGL